MCLPFSEVEKRVVKKLVNLLSEFLCSGMGFVNNR